MIHSEFYDKGPGAWTKKVIRWVLDCRRWAPHSVFQKYVHFIIGLSPILPSDFVSTFKEFADKMFQKQFVTRRHVISKMINNERFKEYENIKGLRDTLAEAVSFTVKFSFVMGIFNYLSTLMHSANQMVATEVIRNVCLKENLGLVMINAKCHSDDSVVSSYHEEDKSVKPSLMLYDWLLKSANHMLSVKKSQVNEDTYLEFLSILYLFNRFLPVVPKFVSSIPFKPSDKGYSSDISFAITQAIEMLSQGGNLEESFLILKLTERFIQKVYNMKHLEDQPFNFLGGIDSHPIELLLAGGMADLTRFLIFQPEKTWATFNFLKKNGCIDDETVDFTLRWDMGSKISSRVSKKFHVYDSLYQNVMEKAPWTLANSKLGNSKLNLLWYINKLRDKLFYASLVDEPIARRYSRIFGASNYRPILSKNGDLFVAQALSVAISAIDPDKMDCTIHGPSNDFINFVNSDLINFYTAISDTQIMGFEACNVLDKPTLFQGSESMLGNLNISATDYVIYKKEPLGYKLLGKSANPFREVQKVDSHLKILGFDPLTLSSEKLYKITRLLFKEESRSYRLISVMRSDSRTINSYTDMLSFLEYNTYRGKRMLLKNKRAAILDWERKIKQGNVPKSVTKYMKCYWTCYVLAKYGVLNKNIYKFDPIALEKKLASEIPLDWRLLVLSSTDTEDVPLSDLSYWSYWSKEQIKIGTKWYGRGTVLLKCPEFVMVLHIDNGSITSIQIETDHSGLFSVTTCWYLSAFFNFSGLSYSLTPSEHGVPGSKYLGYNFNNNTYGFGPSRAFDSIFYNITESEALLPRFTFENLKRTMTGRIFTYYDPHSDNSYKIEFFLPSDTPITMEISEYLDKDKLQSELKTDPSLVDFLKSLSVDLTGFIKIDRQFLFDNMGRSLLYKVLHNLENSTEVYLQTNRNKDSFFRSLIKWKKEHPDFGFPSEAELVDLCKKEDIPPIPQAVYQMLVNLGHSTISEIEFNNMVNRVLSLDPEKREGFLLENFPFLNNNEMIQTIVISMRSERAYYSFRNCGTESIRILVPLIKCIASSIDRFHLTSTVLQNFKGYFMAGSRTRSLSNGRLFEMVSSRLLMNLIQYHKVDSSLDKVQKLFCDMLTEFQADGLMNYLNESSISDPILRSIEFKVDDFKFLDWVLDMLNGLSRSIFRGINMSKENSRSLYGVNGKLNAQVSALGVHFIKMKQPIAPDSVIVTLGKKKLRRMKLKKTAKVTIGVTLLEFFPQTEDGLDEFQSYHYDEDAHDYAEFDREAKIPEIAYVTVPLLTEKALFTVRGTAWTLVIGTNSVDLGVNIATGKKRYFRKALRYGSPYETLNDMCDFMAVVSKENVSISIEGYIEIPWEQQNKIFRASKYKSSNIEIDGVEHTMEEIQNDSTLVAKLYNSEQFFKNPSADSVKQEISISLDQAKLIEKSGRQTSQHFEILKKELEQDLKKLEEKAPNDDEVSSPKQDLDQLLQKTFNGRQELFANWGEKSDSSSYKKQFVADYKPYKYDKALNLLTDIRFRSEFEVFFPGYWDDFINKNIRMSKRNKKHRLEFARLRIDKMPKEMRRNYRKLYLVCCFVLENVTECEHRQNESHDFGSLIDDLFDADFESDEEQVQLIVDLLPDNENLEDYYDLSWLT
jgi:hypothetical protein